MEIKGKLKMFFFFERSYKGKGFPLICQKILTCRKRRFLEILRYILSYRSV